VTLVVKDIHNTRCLKCQVWLSILCGIRSGWVLCSLLFSQSAIPSLFLDLSTFLWGRLINLGSISNICRRHNYIGVLPYFNTNSQFNSRSCGFCNSIISLVCRCVRYVLEWRAFHPRWKAELFDCWPSGKSISRTITCLSNDLSLVRHIFGSRDLEHLQPSPRLGPHRPFLTSGWRYLVQSRPRFLVSPRI
jgi:hypothetical protein